MAEQKGKNPIVTDIYTADPAPMVCGDTLYLYTTHDEDNLLNDFYFISNYFRCLYLIYWRCNVCLVAIMNQYILEIVDLVIF